MGDSILLGFGVICILAIIGLVMLIMHKTEELKNIKDAVIKLKRSVDEMDEQAKLIVRTDMELNKTQEELDKRLNGLYTLQKISRATSTTLEENQIFGLLGPDHLKELGFDKMYAFLRSGRDKGFEIRIQLGGDDATAETLKAFVDTEKERWQQVIAGEKTLASFRSSPETVFIAKTCQVSKMKTAIIAPILPKEGEKGFVIVGTDHADAVVNEGDAEIIAILATQLGEALENARLFEKTWRAQQDLEKKVEERTSALTKLLTEVNIANKRKTDFISSVSHELRTPLTSIKGYAAILLAGKLGEIPPDIQTRLEKINRHSDELVHMVNDLLDIARIEAGKTVMKKEILETKSIADGVLDLLALQMKERQIESGTTVADDAKAVFADHSQLNRILINLVGNALKFTPTGGRITIGAQKKGSFVQFDVIDTGCGIPEDSLEKIFDEFFRVDNSINQEVKGTGLGLSLVKHIVEAHGGKIWVTSKAGAGTTFSFMFPDAPAGFQPAATEARS